jgi:predicted CDP-diglyceride synthetase/phosphatidate cytidylyltransferase
METGIVVALISGAGTLIGSLGGIFMSARLTAYRLKKLEEKVDKHNGLIERMYKIEEHAAVLDEKICVANHRISDLEKGE